MGEIVWSPPPNTSIGVGGWLEVPNSLAALPSSGTGIDSSPTKFNLGAEQNVFITPGYIDPTTPTSPPIMSASSLANQAAILDYYTKAAMYALYAQNMVQTDSDNCMNMNLNAVNMGYGSTPDYYCYPEFSEDLTPVVDCFPLDALPWFGPTTVRCAPECINAPCYYEGSDHHNISGGVFDYGPYLKGMSLSANYESLSGGYTTMPAPTIPTLPGGIPAQPVPASVGLFTPLIGGVSCSAGDPGSGCSASASTGPDGMTNFTFAVEKGAPGDPGPPGADGAPGAAATITVGSTTVVPVGEANVVNVGTSSAAILDFFIPEADNLAFTTTTVPLAQCDGTGKTEYVDTTVQVVSGTGGSEVTLFQALFNQVAQVLSAVLDCRVPQTGTLEAQTGTFSIDQAGLMGVKLSFTTIPQNVTYTGFPGVIYKLGYFSWKTADGLTTQQFLNYSPSVLLPPKSDPLNPITGISVTLQPGVVADALYSYNENI